MKKIISVIVLGSVATLLSACVEENYSQSHYSSRVSAAPQTMAYQQPSSYSSSSSVRSNRYVTPPPPVSSGYSSQQSG